MLARDVVDRGEPLLDAGELGGIEVELLPVAPQRARRLVDLDPRRLEQGDDFGQRRIVRGAGVELRDQRGQPAPQRVVAVGQRVFAGGRGLEQRGRVREPRLRSAKARPIRPRTTSSAASSRRRASSRSRSAAEARAALRRGVALLDRRAPRAPRGAGLAGERREAAERVDERALHVGGGQRLVRVLAVQVDEPLADVLAAARASPAGR